SVPDEQRLRSGLLAGLYREAQATREAVEKCGRGGTDSQSYRDDHRAAGIGVLGEDDFSSIGSRRQRTCVDSRRERQRRVAAAIATRRDAQPSAALRGYRTRTEAERRFVDRGDVDY